MLTQVQWGEEGQIGTFPSPSRLEKDIITTTSFLQNLAFFFFFYFLLSLEAMIETLMMNLLSVVIFSVDSFPRKPNKLKKLFSVAPRNSDTYHTSNRFSSIIYLKWYVPVSIWGALMVVSIKKEPKFPLKKWGSGLSLSCLLQRGIIQQEAKRGLWWS